MISVDIASENKILKEKSPEQIIEWAISLSEKRIITTSFGVYSSVLLSAVSSMDQKINVLWCDTGFNDYLTYNHVNSLIDTLKLNLNIYVPQQTRGYIESRLGLPGIDDPKHTEFTDIVKLEPFRRALEEHQPELWFTNIRSGQTDFRDEQDILSYSNDGILKVSPFYHWSDKDLDAYLLKNSLPKNENYFDPVKALSSRECGIQNLG